VRCMREAYEEDSDRVEKRLIYVMRLRPVSLVQAEQQTTSPHVQQLDLTVASALLCPSKKPS